MKVYLVKGVYNGRDVFHRLVAEIDRPLSSIRVFYASGDYLDFYIPFTYPQGVVAIFQLAPAVIYTVSSSALPVKAYADGAEIPVDVYEEAVDWVELAEFRVSNLKLFDEYAINCFYGNLERNFYPAVFWKGDVAYFYAPKLSTTSTLCQIVALDEKSRKVALYTKAVHPYDQLKTPFANVDMLRGDSDGEEVVFLDDIDALEFDHMSYTYVVTSAEPARDPRWLKVYNIPDSNYFADISGWMSSGADLELASSGIDPYMEYYRYPEVSYPTATGLAELARRVGSFLAKFTKSKSAERIIFATKNVARALPVIGVKVGRSVWNKTKPRIARLLSSAVGRARSAASPFTGKAKALAIGAVVLGSLASIAVYKESEYKESLVNACTAAIAAYQKCKEQFGEERCNKERELMETLCKSVEAETKTGLSYMLGVLPNLLVLIVLLQLVRLAKD